MTRSNPPSASPKRSSQYLPTIITMILIPPLIVILFFSMLPHQAHSTLVRQTAPVWSKPPNHLHMDRRYGVSVGVGMELFTGDVIVLTVEEVSPIDGSDVFNVVAQGDDGDLICLDPTLGQGQIFDQQYASQFNNFKQGQNLNGVYSDLGYTAPVFTSPDPWSPSLVHMFSVVVQDGRLGSFSLSPLITFPQSPKYVSPRPPVRRSGVASDLSSTEAWTKQAPYPLSVASYLPLSTGFIGFGADYYPLYPPVIVSPGSPGYPPVTRPSDYDSYSANKFFFRGNIRSGFCACANGKVVCPNNGGPGQANIIYPSLATVDPVFGRFTVTKIPYQVARRLLENYRSIMAHSTPSTFMLMSMYPFLDRVDSLHFHGAEAQLGSRRLYIGQLRVTTRGTKLEQQSILVLRNLVSDTIQFSFTASFFFIPFVTLGTAPTSSVLIPGIPNPVATLSFSGDTDSKKMKVMTNIFNYNELNQHEKAAYDEYNAIDSQYTHVAGENINGNHDDDNYDIFDVGKNHEKVQKLMSIFSSHFPHHNTTGSKNIDEKYNTIINNILEEFSSNFTNPYPKQNKHFNQNKNKTTHTAYTWNKDRDNNYNTLFSLLNITNIHNNPGISQNTRRLRNVITKQRQQSSSQAKTTDAVADVVNNIDLSDILHFGNGYDHKKDKNNIDDEFTQRTAISIEPSMSKPILEFYYPTVSHNDTLGDNNTRSEGLHLDGENDLNDDRTILMIKLTYIIKHFYYLYQAHINDNSTQNNNPTILEMFHSITSYPALQWFQGSLMNDQSTHGDNRDNCVTIHQVEMNIGSSKRDEENVQQNRNNISYINFIYFEYHNFCNLLWQLDKDNFETCTTNSKMENNNMNNQPHNLCIEQSYQNLLRVINSVYTLFFDHHKEKGPIVINSESIDEYMGTLIHDRNHQQHYNFAVLFQSLSYSAQQYRLTNDKIPTQDQNTLLSSLETFLRQISDNPGNSTNLSKITQNNTFSDQFDGKYDVRVYKGLDKNVIPYYTHTHTNTHTADDLTHLHHLHHTNTLQNSFFSPNQPVDKRDDPNADLIDLRQRFGLSNHQTPQSNTNNEPIQVQSSSSSHSPIEPFINLIEVIPQLNKEKSQNSKSTSKPSVSIYNSTKSRQFPTNTPILPHISAQTTTSNITVLPNLTTPSSKFPWLYGLYTSTPPSFFQQIPSPEVVTRGDNANEKKKTTFLYSSLNPVNHIPTQSSSKFQFPSTSNKPKLSQTTQSPSISEGYSNPFEPMNDSNVKKMSTMQAVIPGLLDTIVFNIEIFFSLGVDVAFGTVLELAGECAVICAPSSSSIAHAIQHIGFTTVPFTLDLVRTEWYWLGQYVGDMHLMTRPVDVFPLAGPPITILSTPSNSFPNGISDDSAINKVNPSQLKMINPLSSLTLSEQINFRNAARTTTIGSLVNGSSAPFNHTSESKKYTTFQATNPNPVSTVPTNRPGPFSDVVDTISSISHSTTVPSTADICLSEPFLFDNSADRFTIQRASVDTGVYSLTNPLGLEHPAMELHHFAMSGTYTATNTFFLEFIIERAG